MIGLFTRVFMAAFIAVLMTGGAAHAQVVLSSTDFNSFSLGSVNGQGGWGITGGYDQEVVNVGIGDNALRVSNRTMSGSFSDQLFAPRPGVFVGESSTANSYSPVISNHLNVSFRFSTATQAVQDDARSTFSTDDGTGGRQSFIALRGCGAGQVCVDTFDVLPDGSFAGPIQLAAFLTVFVIHIAQWGFSWPIAFFYFGLHASLYVLAQIQNKLVGNTKFNSHH